MYLVVLNGPNLNMLGIREPEVYGSMTYEELVYFLHEQAVALGVEIEVFQSNCEGEIVNEIQRAYRRIDGIIINPAAYTHTSIAILDALKAVSIPAAEVHLSDVTKREEFRQVSYAGMACEFHFIGEGKQGYVNAMKALKEKLEAAH